MSTPIPPQKPSLLTLPPEIREAIYRLILNPDANRVHHRDEYASYNFASALVLFRLNRQIYYESRKVFRDLNTFVRIETPWPEAQQHIEREGHVPVLLREGQTARFKDYSLWVSIDAPEHPIDTQRFVILLDDLEKFARMWFYADLSHPGLNPHLHLTLKLRDPYSPEYEEKRMSKALQRRLLLPFTQVKDLRGTVVEGDPKPLPSVEKEMREGQQKQHNSPEHCLREATKLKGLGNSQLKAGNYEQALRTYTEAWAAMHVVIKGRQRHIHADAFFGRELREEPYRGKNGQSERLVLRVQLVSNTCLCHLKLGNYEECTYWGMRSINMLREALGADPEQYIPPRDEAVLGFPAAESMGRIYFRTAVAFKQQDEMYKAQNLLEVAKLYLGAENEDVKRELRACTSTTG